MVARLGMMACFMAFGLGLLAAPAVDPSPEAFLPLHEGRDAYKPAAAFGKGIYLVAWQSGRTGPGDLRNGHTFIGDIVGCRLDRAGKAVDAKPFVISGAADLQELPRAAFGGGTFLVVWQDLRNGKDWDVYASRVTPDGNVLDPAGILISGGIHNQAKPRVTWDGKSFLVVWQDFRSGKRYQVHCARVSADGVVLDPAGVMLGSATFYHCYSPTVASAGDGRSFVLWVGSGWPGDSGRIPMTTGLFVADGKAEGGVAYINSYNRDHGPSGTAQPIAMASGKDTYLAAWKTDSPQGRGGAQYLSNAATFDFTGARKTNLHLAGATGGKTIVDTDVAWDGSAFVVAWHEFVRETNAACPSDVVFAARVSTAGLVDGSVVRVSGALQSPASQVCVASDGAGGSLIAYEKHPATGDVPIKVGYRTLTTLTSPSSDTDGDGLPDAWETSYFGNLAQGPTGDPDGDGSNNLQEYQAGTDPTVATVPVVAPSITTQPSNRSVTAGQTATFSVVASGTAPLSYQWQKNGANIAGATGASYTTPATTAADSGATYRVAVSNSAGNVTSSSATLTVTAASTAPTITTQPTNRTVNEGQTASFSVVASGTAPLSYQWQKNGVNIAGATSASYTTPATVAADNGSTYRVVVSNGAGTVTSNAATLTLNPPGTALAHWKLDETSGTTAADFTGNGNTGTLVNGPTWTTGRLAGGLSFDGINDAMTTANINGLVAGNTPHTLAAWVKVAGLPARRAWIALLGTTGAGAHHWLITSTGGGQFGSWSGGQVSPTLTVGSWTHVAITFDGAQLTGYVNGVSIGTSAASFNLQGPPLALAQAQVGENYFNGSLDDVRIYGRALTATEVSTLVGGGGGATAPSITTQPSNRTVTVGQTATFFVVASGTAPLNYQWQKNGANIAGATGASYTTPATVAADSGATYRVVVSSAAGSATSNAAILTVTAVPPADSDGDGLSDAWEQQHFGGLTQGAGGDPDGDGETNFQEFQGNSDPMDPASRPAGALPLPWLHQDMGSVGLAGSASHAGGAFTVKGAGADIWGTADGFHLVYQPLNGDGQITARVASVQNTNAWAKAGVMIRESLTAGSTNAFMAVTPSNGVLFQRRAATGGVTASSAGSMVTAPIWLRVVRSGSTLIGYLSTDGVNWTAVGTQAIPMGAGVFVGLAVTSHAAGTLNTSVFDNVSVVQGSPGAGGIVADAGVSGGGRDNSNGDSGCFASVAVPGGASRGLLVLVFVGGAFLLRKRLRTRSGGPEA